MLRRNFELISIKFRFFINFFKVAQKLGQRAWATVQDISSKMAKRKIIIFIIFSDAYTCSWKF